MSNNQSLSAPYPEVRASVSNIDDPSMPVLTFRMWIIGLSLCSISTALNTFFNFRFPAPTIAPLVLLLLSHPLGKFGAYILPIKKYHLPHWLGSYEFSFNPGPWNIKEHVCVFLMANVSVKPAYAINAVVVTEVFYKVKLGVGFDLTLILATQLTGFGIAGFVRRFLVWPGSMIWPQNLVACTLLNTLHAEDETIISAPCSISRYKFFMLASAAAFAFYFLPGFLFQALSIFSYICWMAPNNVVVNQLFGVRSGLGLGILTFDWSQISFIESPLMVPWWAQVHVILGFILFYWIIAPILYYSNVWNLSHLPMVSSIPYDNTGSHYNVSRIMSGAQPTFNATAYADYSPLYLPATYVIGYLLAIALSTCVLTHTILHHGRSVINNIRNVSVEEDDVHAKLMRHYPEVPNWWYATCVAFFFSVAVLSIKIWPTGMPIWSLCLAVMLPVIYILPSGFIYAFTGQTVTLNLIAEVIPGALLPGNPLANMIFKAYSVQSLAGALCFVQDLKLGHYLKTPPRASFLVQLVATILACFTQVGVKTWLFANVHDLCSVNQKDLLTCPRNEVMFTASAVWGLIGPARQFGRHAIYGPELYALIFGAIIPLPFWLYRQRFPDSKLPCINMPVFLNGPSRIPPATGINYSSWFAVGFVFQYLIRTRNFAWWSKFNYILSAALDSGTGLSICAVFFFLQFPAGGVSLNWIGNTIFTHTADWELKPFIPPSSTPF
ncbi:OPT oligopeptide transporter [Hysterangium stoloniferum]|nr:OPT oligopeptide transporter [Hysterangium stoloniferum]